MPDILPESTTPPDSLTAGMREDARAIFNAGLKAADPCGAVYRHCMRKGNLLLAGEKVFDLATVEKIFVVGAGKAAAAMAQAAEELLGERINDGLISVKYDHGLPLKRIRTIEAGHPLPDAQGRQAARQILDMVGRSGNRDLVIVLLSGGASALMPSPAPGIRMQDKQAATQEMLACGASIHEINAVRKHLSSIKGGQLAQAAKSAGAMLTLILSDVVGDELDVIASGPTVPDESTYDDCLAIIRRKKLGPRLPAAIQAHLAAGAAGLKPETPKRATHSWQHVLNLIVGNNFEAIRASSAEAASRGYMPVMLSTRIQGETREVARMHSAIALEVLASGNPESPPACLLSGGETTVTVRGSGLGGRNQEFALAAALDISGAPHIVVLSAGTDGTDGPTDAAGAIVDHTTVQRAAQAGLDLRGHLDDNDAYPFFKRLGDLFITGPTRTNVMDVRIILIRESAEKAKVL